MASSERREYRFLLAGKSGSGKSSTANTLMGNEDFTISFGMASGTKTCEMRARDLREFKANFTIIDTPGLFDPKASNEEIKDQIVKASACLSPGAHAILFVIRMDRFTPEERDTFMQLKTFFDPDIVKYTIIIFTKKDEMKKNKKTTQQIVDMADEPFKQVLQECGGRVMAFDNVNKRKREKQVKELLEIVQRMLKENGDKPYHCAVQEVVNIKLKRRVTIRASARIENEPVLKVHFDDMEEEFNQRTKSAEEHKKELTHTVTKEEMLREQLEETKKREQEAREELERIKQEEEKKKKEQEKREREAEEEEMRRKEEEEKERQRQKEEQERKKREEMEKELIQLRAEKKLQEELAKEKDRLREESEAKLAEERMKVERQEMLKTKEDIAANKEQHWVRNVFDGFGGVANCAWKAATAWLAKR